MVLHPHAQAAAHMTTAAPPSSDDIEGDRARETICELCRLFWQLGWASGTGGGISVRVGERIFMAPSGVEK